MAVGADHAAVQTDVCGVHRGHRFQLGGDEVRLGEVVLLIQQLHHGQLHPILLLALHGLAAHQDVQLLAGDALGQGLLALLRTQVGKQVVDDQLGLIPLADGNLDGGTVLQSYHAVQLQRDGHPLVFADAAVIVGLQVGQLLSLVEGGGLQVQTGAVDVGRRDLRALRQGLLTDDRQQQHLAPVVLVHPVPGLQLHPPMVGAEPLLLRQTDALADALPLGLAGVQKCLIALAVAVHRLPLLGGHPVIAVLLFGEKGLLPLFCFHFHALLL